MSDVALLGTEVLNKTGKRADFTLKKKKKFFFCNYRSDDPNEFIIVM